MESALDEIEFLALSSNRVELLQLLAERRRTRRELGEATGASQATLGRILGDFEERHWVRRDDGGYVATPTGRLVASEFTDLLSVLETERRLRPVVPYLPDEALSFDLSRLAEATLTLPTEMRPNAPLQRLLKLVSAADDLRVFSHAFNEQTLRTLERRATAGTVRFEAVFSRAAIDALAAEPELRSRLATLLDAPDVSVRVTAEELPVAVTVADDTVNLLVRDDDGVLRAAIDVDDPAVHEWATDSFERHWEAAAPLDADALPSTDE